MSEEETMTPETDIGAEDYISKLNEIKSGMVDKAEYDRVMSDNRKLADALANNKSFGAEEKKEAVDINALRKDLFDPDARKSNDLEYFTKVLTLRDALIDKGEPDVFLPFNSKYIPTDDDRDKAQHIADELRECIEYANGDPSIFSVELARRCGKR